MSSPESPSVREILIDSLGRLSETEKEKLYGPNWAHFAGRKVKALRQSRKWVLALAVTMGLLAIVLPTSAFYHYHDAAESFSLLEFLGAVGGACLFAGLQMAWAVHMYMNWQHQLQCYRGLRALGRTTAPDNDDEDATPASQHAG